LVQETILPSVQGCLWKRYVVAFTCKEIPIFSCQMMR